MKVLFLILLPIALFIFVFATWDGEGPSIEWMDGLEMVGPLTEFQLGVTDTGRGLREIHLRVRQGERTHLLLSEEHPNLMWPLQSGVKRQEIHVSWTDFRKKVELQEGPFELVATAADIGDFGLFSDQTTLTRTLTYDSTPPRLGPVSNQHYVRQGGSQIVVYQVSSDTASSGVRVGDAKFVGYPFGEDPGLRVCLFALRHDQAADDPIRLWAIDAAGNRAEAGFFSHVLPGRFRERNIQITDNFIQSVAPEILAQIESIQAAETPLETFLLINGPLRHQNNQQIAELAKQSEPRQLWSQPFLQLSNSQVESAFADKRTYLYQGKAVDVQTHLGFDLASLAQSPVEASNDGKVLFAGYLGIYGNTVVLDHGLGLLSLYGHLRALDVSVGDSVTRGQSLGWTGQTGLAGGDHLHFTMIVQGVQVNPLEWWDPEWLSIQLARLQPTAETDPESGLPPE